MMGGSFRHLMTASTGLAVSLAGCQGPAAPNCVSCSVHATSDALMPGADSAPSKPPTASEETELGPSIKQASWQEEGKLPDPRLAPDDAGPAVPVDAVLGLPETIELGLTRNPDLIALRQAEGVNQALVGVARTYPFNPTVQTRILPYGRFERGGSTSAYNYVLLWQTFELAHQRRRRTENATAALDQTRWTIQQAELLNVAMTVQLYFTALYQDGLRKLAWTTSQLNDQLYAVSKKRFDAGGASAADVALTKLDARSARRQAELADITYDNALRALRRQLNLDDDFPIRFDAQLVDFTWHKVSGQELCRLTGADLFALNTEKDQLAAELAAGRPDVLAARAGVGAANANLRLARAARIPNVMIGPFYIRDAAATLNVGFQAQMDIPVVNNGMPLVRQRQAELHQQAVTFDQLEARARIEVRTALERYEQARRLCERDREEIKTPLPEELSKLEAQFKKGDIDVLRVFQARTSLLQLQRVYLDSLNELAQAASALTAASGLPPAALISR